MRQLAGDSLRVGRSLARDPSGASQSTKTRPPTHENTAFQRRCAPDREHPTRHRSHHGQIRSLMQYAGKYDS